jgi:hypothetical protein
MLVDTKREAHDSIKPHKSRLIAEIYAFIQSKGINGATCYEIETAPELAELCLTHQCASARCTELMSLGLVERSGELRKTNTGRRAHVLIAKTFS